MGEAVPIAEGIGTSITRAFFSASAAGVLVYRSGGAGGTQLSWYDRAGHVLGRAGDLAEYSDLALSPDNSRVAYSRPSEGGNRQVWVLEIARGTNTRLSFMSDGARSPVWSPDGKRIAFTSVRSSGIYVKDANGGGAERMVFRAPALSFVNDWSRDGRYLLYTDPIKSLNVRALPDPLGGSEPKPIPAADSAFNETQGQFSPDSRWVAYASDETGRYEIYVRPFPPGDGRSGEWLVSSAGGREPRWRADGKELYYMSPDHNLMAVDVQTEPVFQSSTPHHLFPAPPSAGASNVLFGYDVTRDGKRFLMRAPAIGEASAPATVVLNWEGALRGR